MTPTEQQIDFTLSNFDFHLVHKVMTMLDWCYHPMQRVPTEGELYAFAEALLRQAVEEDDILFSGGFEAGSSEQHKSMYLKFVLDEVFVNENGEN